MSMLYGDPMLAAPPMTPVAALPVGAHIGDWAVLRVLHEGRHGFVYLARDPVRAVTAVLKEFVPRVRAVRLADGAVLPRRADDSIALSVARVAFVQEATALAGIGHARLVRVLGLFQARCCGRGWSAQPCWVLVARRAISTACPGRRGAHPKSPAPAAARRRGARRAPGSGSDRGVHTRNRISTQTCACAGPGACAGAGGSR